MSMVLLITVIILVPSSECLLWRSLNLAHSNIGVDDYQLYHGVMQDLKKIWRQWMTRRPSLKEQTSTLLKILCSARMSKSVVLLLTGKWVVCAWASVVVELSAEGILKQQMW